VNVLIQPSYTYTDELVDYSLVDIHSTKKNREISVEICLASTRLRDTHLEYCLNIVLSSGEHIP